MGRPRDRHTRRELELRETKELYNVVRRRFERDRDELDAAWKELFKGQHEALTSNRGSCLARLISGLRLLKGQPLRRGHGMQYLGERAMEGVQVRPWTYWRAKKKALEEAWIYRFEQGGGRLAKKAGGGRGGDGRFRGRADGILPGPHVTGWSDERYTRLLVEPPPQPRVREVDPEDAGAESIGQEFTSNRAYLLAIEHRTRPPT